MDRSPFGGHCGNTNIVSIIYDPSVFMHESLDSAIHCAVTPGPDITAEERWRTETPYLVDLICRHLRVTDNSVILDYGCGVGRIAKALIERCDCKVVGVDISSSMCGHAIKYVGSENFSVCDHSFLDCSSIKCDFAICIWVLQHCLDPENDLQIVRKRLKPDGRIFAVNQMHRAVPTNRGWMSDSRDVRDILNRNFRAVDHGKLDPTIVTDYVSSASFWEVLAR